MSSSSLLPHLVPVSHREIWRSSVGAFLGLLITGFVAQAAVGLAPGLPLLMAPIGASTVLLFAAPASPLAQPWSVIGGNVIAATVGVTCAHLIPETALAASLAVAISIGLMLVCRCLHPPSGAVALTAVIGGPAISQLGYLFILWPVAINSIALLLLAIIYNRLIGREYPHRRALRTSPLQAATADGIAARDIEAAISERDEVVPVDPADLETIVHRAEDIALLRRSTTTVEGLMARNVSTVRPATSLRVLLRSLRKSGDELALVVDASGRLLGSVGQADLLTKANWGPPVASSGLGWRLRALSNSDRPLRGKVADIMIPVRAKARVDVSIAQAGRLLLVARQAHLPVVDEQDRVLGILTQADLFAAMFPETLPPADRAA